MLKTSAKTKIIRILVISALFISAFIIPQTTLAADGYKAADPVLSATVASEAGTETTIPDSNDATAASAHKDEHDGTSAAAYPAELSDGVSDDTELIASIPNDSNVTDPGNVAVVADASGVDTARAAGVAASGGEAARASNISEDSVSLFLWFMLLLAALGLIVVVEFWRRNFCYE